jgi:hypothetical protein
MPIEGLTNIVRIPRLGKIRLGIKAKSNKKDSEYPKATDYFVVPNEVKEVYGDKPTELEIMFPVEDPEMFAQQWLRAYSMSQGLVCIGNGLEAKRKVDVETGAMANHETNQWEWHQITCESQECPEYQSKTCRRVMNLQFLLPEVPGLGVWQCMSDDTEILTDRGWLSQDQVSVGDKAITLNLNTGHYQKQAIEQVIRWPRDKYQMVHFHQRSLDVLLTPGHRVIYHSDCDTNTWKVGEALQIPKRSIWPVTGQINQNEKQLPLPGRTTCIDCGIPLKTPTFARKSRPHKIKNSPWRGQLRFYQSTKQVRRCWPCSVKARTFTRRGIDPLQDDVLRLLSWVVTEGGTSGKGIRIHQSIHHNAYITEIRCTLTALFGQTHEQIIPGRQIYINGKSSYRKEQTAFRLNSEETRFVHSLLHEGIHRIPRDLLNLLSPRQLKILYDTLLKGDGCRYKNKNNNLRQSIQFFPGLNKGLADDFQELCTRLGFRASITKRGNQWYVSVNETRAYYQFHNKGVLVEVASAPWCVSVPNKSFVARRNGAVFTTGNCDTSSFYSIVNINSMIKMLQGMLGRCSMIPLTLALGPIEVSPPGLTKKTVYIMHIKKDIKIAELARIAQLPAAKVLIPEPEADEPPEDLFPEAVEKPQQKKSKKDLPWKEGKEVKQGEEKSEGKEAEEETEIPQVDDDLLKGWQIARSSIQALGITDKQIANWFAHYKISVGLADFAKALPRQDITNEMVSKFVTMLDAYKEQKATVKSKEEILD